MFWPSTAHQHQSRTTKCIKISQNAREKAVSKLLSQAKASEALIEKVPKAITAFEEAFQNLDLRQQKAQLQTILKSAHVYNDGKIELEFRGESG